MIVILIGIGIVGAIIFWLWVLDVEENRIKAEDFYNERNILNTGKEIVCPKCKCIKTERLDCLTRICKNCGERFIRGEG